MARSGLLTTRKLFVITAVGVAVFIVALALLIRESGTIESFGQSVAKNATPSIERLNNSRTLLLDMQASTGTAIEAAAEGRAPDTTFFERDDRQLHSELAAYLLLQFYPGERELYLAIDESVDAFERSIAKILPLLEGGRVNEAREIFQDQTIPGGVRASTALQTVINFDAAQVRKMSLEMVSVRQRVTVLAYLLDALALVAAAILMLLTAGAMKATARLAEERRLRAEARAGEMELFAGRIAHDLKNPLGTLALRLAVLKRRFGEEAADHLNGPVLSMNRMIDDLLAFAVAGSKPNAGSSELREVVDEVVGLLREEAASAHCEVDTSGCAAVKVAISRGALVSVVSNLLHNAFKFIVEASGERKVTVRCESRGGRVRFEVEDTGPGIPPGAAEKIFDPFVRAAGARSDGFGLGLATVKRLVEACGGAVSVESASGRGTCFRVELPEVVVRA